MDINTTDEYIECPTCEGTGTEAFEDDSYQVPAVKYAPCQECHGEKEIENENYDIMENTTPQNQSLYQILLSEARAKGLNQKQISKAVGKQDRNLWLIIKKESIKFDVMIEIANKIGLEIIIKNPEENRSYTLNKKKS